MAAKIWYIPCNKVITIGRGALPIVRLSEAAHLTLKTSQDAMHSNWPLSSNQPKGAQNTNRMLRCLQSMKNKNSNERNV